MTYEEIISRVSTETGLPSRLVDKTYKSYWRAIREHIKSLPLKKELTDEEFMQIRPNINLPSLGKLNVTLDRYRYKVNKCKKQNNNVGNNKN